MAVRNAHASHLRHLLRRCLGIIGVLCVVSTYLKRL